MYSVSKIESKILSRYYLDDTLAMDEDYLTLVYEEGLFSLISAVEEAVLTQLEEDRTTLRSIGWRLCE